MLDYRIETFLMLCKERNYSKTARELNITQPAVTQHIQYLERMYKVKLFEYENKKLVLTKQGKILESMARGLSASNKRIFEIIEASKASKRHLIFGASYSIGEYCLVPIIKRLLQTYAGVKITMVIDNSDTLLEKLQEGELDCIFIEGAFAKEEYDHLLFAKERFVGISGMEFTKKQIENLQDETIICREKRSSSRIVLDEILEDAYFNVDKFSNVIEIQSNNIIKELVKERIGISFMYESVVRKELEEKVLYEIPFEKPVYREFNFVVLKNHMFYEEYYKFYCFAKEVYEELYGQSIE